jgi:hypothetical protein
MNDDRKRIEEIRGMGVADVTWETVEFLLAQLDKRDGVLERWLYIFDHRAMAGAALADVVALARKALGDE